MADVTDVENTLGALATAVIYPNGTGNPSIVNAPVIIYSGWPNPAQLDTDLAAGKSHVSIKAMNGMESNTTRFLEVMEPQPAIPAANLTLIVSSNKITVGGAIKAGEAAFALVNYKPYAYIVLVSDTLTSVAANLAALISNASVNGTVITIGGNVFDIEVKVSVPTLMQAEIARQKHVFMLNVWAQTPALRASIAMAVDASFKGQPRIVLPDNTWARLIYRGTNDDDDVQKQGSYRRLLRYEVEYVTSMQETDNTVTNFAVSTSLNGNPATTINI